MYFNILAQDNNLLLLVTKYWVENLCLWFLIYYLSRIWSTNKCYPTPNIAIKNIL